MRIGIFAYNFPHKKTQEGLVKLWLRGIRVDCIFAADPVQLTFYQSNVRVGPKGLHYEHPRDIASRMGIPYYVVVHNSVECVKLVHEYRLDLGIILGARILKQFLIDSFAVGILNMHPGIIPENRGLDNLKWAVLLDMPQAVTAHLISKRIDHGRILERREVPVFEDDTLLDIDLRLHNTELAIMTDSIIALEGGSAYPVPLAEDGTYRHAVPPELESSLMERFAEYKKARSAART